MEILFQFIHLLVLLWNTNRSILIRERVQSLQSYHQKLRWQKDIRVKWCPSQSYPNSVSHQFKHISNYKHTEAELKPKKLKNMESDLLDIRMSWKKSKIISGHDQWPQVDQKRSFHQHHWWLMTTGHFQIYPHAYHPRNPPTVISWMKLNEIEMIVLEWTNVNVWK